MMPCPICQHPNPSGATVCQSCGSPLGASAGVATPSFALPSGTPLFNGRYVIERELGAGGFGITYKATDTLLSRSVAIKEFFLWEQCVRQGKNVVPLPTLKPQDYQDSRQEFITEAQVVAKITHHNKVDVYDVFEENNTAYMVMEFVEGKNLLDLLMERGGVMDEREAIGYITQVAEALEAMHQASYLHRDIKPQNIMVTNDGRAVLIDFGAAKQFIAQKTQSVSSAALTPGYAPLEQYGSRARFGPPLDIYALGATLYHLLTGQVPPPAPDRAQGVDLVPPHQLNPKVSRSVSEVVMKAMEMKVADRPQTVSEFITALHASVGTPSISQQPVGTSQLTPKPHPTPPAQPPKPVLPLRYLGRRVGEKIGAVTGALSGAVGGLGLGIAAGFILIAAGAIIGAIGGGIAGAIAGAQAENESGCGAMAVGLIGGAILGYFIGIFVATILAIGASVGALAVGGYRGMQFGTQFGSDLSEKYGVVPTSLLLSAITGCIIGLVWTGLVLYVQPVEWTEAAAFVAFLTVIGAMTGSIIGFLGFQFLVRQQGGQTPSTERLTALLSFPVGLLLALLFISMIPSPQRWWDVTSISELWRQKVEGQVREQLGSPPSESTTERMSPPYTPSSIGEIRYVQVTQANVRSGPDTRFSVLRVLSKGAMVRVIGTSDDGKWAKVVLEDGTVGYISRKLLGTSLYAPPSENANQYKFMATVDDPDGYTYIRSGPGTQYRVIGKVHKGEVFRVVSTKGNWWQIRTEDGKSGYIHKSRIRRLN